MQVISTVGPDNGTKTVLPFIAAKGAMTEDRQVDLFLMQEATYLGASDLDLDELVAPGLPSVAQVLEQLREGDAIRSAVVCDPCADARGIGKDDLRDWASLGGAGDLVQQVDRNETTLTF